MIFFQKCNKVVDKFSCACTNPNTNTLIILWFYCASNTDFLVLHQQLTQQNKRTCHVC